MKEKGVLGITLKTYGIISFLLAIAGFNILAPLLVTAVAILVEKDEKAGHASLTAAFLSIIMWLADYSISWIGTIIRTYALNNLATTTYGKISSTITYINFIIIAVGIVFGIMGLLHVSQGRKPSIPIASGLANMAYGFVQENAPQYSQQPFQQPYPPQQPYQPYPSQNAAPQPAAYAPSYTPVAPPADQPFTPAAPPIDQF